MKQLTSFLLISSVIFFIILRSNSCTSTNKTDESLYPDCISSDIELVDTCLLGKPLRNAINKLQLDTSKFFAFTEPPGILRGINIQILDTCEIEIYVDRTSIIGKKDSLEFRLLYLHIVDKNIIGLSWAKRQKNKSKSMFLQANKKIQE